MLNGLVAYSENEVEQGAIHSLVPQKETPVQVIKEQNIRGTVRNTRFDIEQAIFKNGTLEIRQGKEFFADVSVEIVTLENDDQSSKTFSSFDAMNQFESPIRLGGM